MLGIPTSKASYINSLKQKYSVEIFKYSVFEDKELIIIFDVLHTNGYKIHVASNAIRATIELILRNLGLINYVDFIISNEDVKCIKPNPEMYLKAMMLESVSPRETLIVEDSYVGRTCAYNSCAHLCPVDSRKDVTLEYIMQSIKKNDDYKVIWKDNNLNVLIPMAGAGSRFAKAGYTFPKPLIDVKGKPMIQVVVNSLDIDAHYIYIVRTEDYEKYNLKYMLEAITPNCDIVQCNKLTEGAAVTTLLAKDLINTDKHLFIVNSDQIIEYNSGNFMYSCLCSNNCNGGILTFENCHPKWSYVKTDDNSYITEIAEKKVISNQATCGLYLWSKGSDYVHYAEQMITKNIRVNNEFYVAPVYNEAINDNKKFKAYQVEKMIALGTPEDLNTFLANN